jgi:peptidoglycan/LPS O-acetylase OafA/YrhL
MGILLSIIFSSPHSVSFLSSKVSALKSLTFLFFASCILFTVILQSDIWYSFGNSLIVLTFGCLLTTVQIQCLLNQNIRILNLAFLRYLGLRCYFIYLFHIFFMLIAKAVPVNFFIGLMIQSTLTLGFAHLSWRYLEAPLIKLGRKFPYEILTGAPL